MSSKVRCKTHEKEVLFWETEASLLTSLEIAWLLLYGLEVKMVTITTERYQKKCYIHAICACVFYASTDDLEMRRNALRKFDARF